MKKLTLVWPIVLLLCLLSTISSGREKSSANLSKRSTVGKIDSIPGKRLYWGKRTDGYLVYNNDTIRGFVMLYRRHVLIEQPLDAEYSYFHDFKLTDRALKSIVMYNAEKKPVRLTRLNENERRMLRVVHEGRLNIYDGRVGFVYRPRDIDKNLLVISYDGIIDDLSSFLTETTKSDLILYINDIYGMKLNPRKISWRELLLVVDQLD
jgi:hypothetical protein